MARNNALNFNLPSADDLFSTEESRAEAKLERIVNLSPSEISNFPNHPFKVRMDAAMQEMTESVKQYGVLVPALVRPKPDGGYEMVAGHRRKKAAELANLTEIPCIVRQLTDDEATIIMVDSNLQREQILPSEKAFAYKMKLDAMKRQGQRTDLTSDPLGQKLKGVYSVEMVAHETPDSKTQVQRFIRLTNLIPEILELVDNSVLKDPETLQIALRHAVQALRIPAVLSRMEHGFSHAGKAMEQCAGKLDVFRDELHQAGSHMKSAGRALAGKEVQQAQELEADKGVLAKLRGLFLSCGKTFSGMERGAARLAEKAGGEKSSVKSELRELKAAPDAPHRQTASKEQAR